jgi:hypothetical protein
VSANEAQAGFDAMGTYSQPAPTDGPMSKNIVGSAARGPSPDATFDAMSDVSSANQQSVPTSVKHIV